MIFYCSVSSAAVHFTLSLWPPTAVAGSWALPWTDSPRKAASTPSRHSGTEPLPPLYQAPAACLCGPPSSRTASWLASRAFRRHTAGPAASSPRSPARLVLWHALLHSSLTQTPHPQGGGGLRDLLHMGSCHRLSEVPIALRGEMISIMGCPQRRSTGGSSLEQRQISGLKKVTGCTIAVLDL
jgi:hypothetical protein